MSDGMFDSYSRYYDRLYRDKDYRGETDAIVRRLKRRGITQGNLLEFGSGTGKHGRLLAAAGYQVHGIERNADMAALAAQGNGFTCEPGDIRTTRVGQRFDAVLSLFHVISYQTTNADLHAVFARSAEHLAPGGLFLFDCWYSPAVYAQRPSVRVKRMADEDVEIVRLAEPVIHANENRVDVRYTLFATDRASGAIQTLQTLGAAYWRPPMLLSRRRPPPPPSCISMARFSDAIGSCSMISPLKIQTLMPMMPYAVLARP